MSAPPQSVLAALDADRAQAYIGGVCDDSQRSVRKCDGRFLRTLHELALARGYDALTALDVVNAHGQAYANVEHKEIHIDVMAALVRFDNEAVIREAIRISRAPKAKGEVRGSYYQFAGTTLATLAFKVRASDAVVQAVCDTISAAQRVTVLGRCVGDHRLVDRIDRMMPGLKMGQEALRQAIVADDAWRTGPNWERTDWIDLVTARVPEAQRVIGKPLLEPILFSVRDQPCAIPGLIAIKEPSAAAAAGAQDAIPRDVAHLLYVLTCVHGWRYCNDADFFARLRWSDGTFRNYQRGLVAARFAPGGKLRAHKLGKALKEACERAAANNVPKSHGVQLPLPARKRLGIVM